MSEDNVVIEIGCMRYVVGVSDISCPLKNSGGSCIACKTQVPEVYAVCNEMGAVSCISATKIQRETKMYFAWNREEARGLINEKVEFHSGRINDDWAVGTLLSIRDLAGDSFQIRLGAGIYSDHPIIREIPTTKLTLAQLIEMAGIGGDVEIIEE